MLRFVLVGALLVGCTAKPTAPPRKPSSAPAPLTRTEALAAAHAFFDAVDRHDTAAFRAMLTPSFALFEDGRITPAEKLSGTWAEAVANGLPPRTRSCTKQQVRIDTNTAVYVGDCRETVPAYKKRKKAEWDGWNTLVLVRAGRTWRVALWQWQRSGVALEKVRWNYAYSRGTGYIKKPNRLLVTTVAGVKPGKALVLAMGQGRNALHLAALGWQVTGLDISDEGLRIARREAARRKLTIDARLQDINKYQFGTNRWDLVTMLYAGNDVDWIKRLAPSVKPGGLVVIEYFHSTDDEGFKTGQLATLFAGWNIVRDEVVDDHADWTRRKTKLVRFVAKKR